MKKGLVFIAFLMQYGATTGGLFCQAIQPQWVSAGLRRPIEQVIVSADKKRFVTVESAGGLLIRMWDSRSGFLLRTLEHEPAPDLLECHPEAAHDGDR
ncbi:MAG: hypothetical protein Q8916_08245, partial [Bacteroidota bacterium]|nr:hypothetical protein [Bacteroidota bacterium]